MKRFYKNALPEGLDVLLDGKALMTPLRRPLVATTPLLAQKIAQEWQEQGDTLDPRSMPLTQLLNTLIDKVMEGREVLQEEILRHAAGDLICYYAPRPADLAARQKAAWQGVHEWLATQGVVFNTTQAMTQEPQDSARIRALIENLNDVEFTALQAAAPALGSVAIALMLVKDAIDPVAAFDAAIVDETYQMEKWGEDEQARARLERLRWDVVKVAEFLRAARPT